MTQREYFLYLYSKLFTSFHVLRTTNDFSLINRFIDDDIDSDQFRHIQFFRLPRSSLPTFTINLSPSWRTMSICLSINEIVDLMAFLAKYGCRLFVSLTVNNMH